MIEIVEGIVWLVVTRMTKKGQVFPQDPQKGSLYLLDEHDPQGRLSIAAMTHPEHPTQVRL